MAEGSRGTTVEKIRLLFFMHVDWNWIKQRPHFIAEELSRDGRFDVRVVHLPSWRRWNLTSNRSGVRRVPIWLLPARTSRFSRVVNRAIARALLRIVQRRWRPRATLITSPTLYTYLPDGLRTAPLFYDCMDVADAFGDGRGRDLVRAAERDVTARATGIFVSSAYLGDLIEGRYPNARAKPVLVRNGWEGGEIGSCETSSRGEGRPRTVAYFGTISSWLDLPILLSCLERFRELEVQLMGPVLTKLPVHQRLHIAAPVPHDELFRAMRDVDGLILPFRMNDLTRGVDPVKLYEYLALGKPAICVYYPELEHFRGLVHFYTNAEELHALVECLIRDPVRLCPDAAAVGAFLVGATWKRRAAIVADAIAGSIAV
jgi:glycosyltransferase involved in cell wall biosynthesis